MRMETLKLWKRRYIHLNDGKTHQIHLNDGKTELKEEKLTKGQVDR